ncbi:uncharacterized protein LOC122505003 [Leptopilina heterotoma]|uniref:uncharacterized protein LOC122505003 n=1 Tax=Leptopilina heterotoma TaxID=63436 RepID=UPI001CAA2758|nr:uncharacterized protein LOC122505003 [Leptopilina heterotoma]
MKLKIFSLFVLMFFIAFMNQADGERNCVVGKSFYDGCNTCICGKGNIHICTEMACGEIDPVTNVMKEHEPLPPPEDFYEP